MCLLCPCLDCFKPARAMSDESLNIKAKNRRKEESNSDEDEEETTTAVSKPRKHRQLNEFEKFFQGRNVDRAFTQRLSTINNDRLINFIELPLKLNMNEGCEGAPPSWYTINTYVEFFTSMGYRQIKELGKGGFGQVLLVEKRVPLVPGEVVKGANRVDNNYAYYRMACKVLRLPDDKASQNRSAFQSLRAELYVLQGLKGKCPYVIEYYEHFVLRFQLASEKILMAHIFMELADGGTMVNEVEKKGPFPLKLARRYFSEMAQGLEFMHRNQIAHNDVKLDNCLLVRDTAQPKVKHCKLTDFGMSRFAWKDGVGLLYSERYQGTRHYMAGEVFRCGMTSPNNKNGKSKQYVPFKADIWALAICLYCMLTRRFPYEPPKRPDNKQLTTFLNQLQTVGPTVAKEMKQKFNSPKLSQLIGQMLEFDPDKRASIATVIAHSWLKSKNRTG